jgi:uncharacterized protein (TIRG00374 family)
VSRRRQRLVAAGRIVLAIAVVVLVTWLVLVPQFGDVTAGLSRFASLAPALVVAAAVAEVLSLLSFSVLSRAILGRELPFHRLLTIDMADLAVNHTLPGGGATAAAVRYRLIRSEGVSPRRALGLATLETAVSNVFLATVFAVGAVLTVGRMRGSSAYLVAGIVTSAVIVMAVVAGWMLVRHPRLSRRVAGRIGRFVPFVRASRAESFVAELSRMLAEVIADRRRALAAGLAAAGTWLLDAAALGLILAAFGSAVDPGVLLAAYGVGCLLGQLPLTPGGLGIVEGSTAIALVGFGVDHATAVLAVVGWRVLEFWLPTPIGWLCYLFLRIRTGVSSSRRPVAIVAAASLSPAAAQPLRLDS